MTRLIEFDERDPVFDQESYEMRIRAEADIMVALEAEKSSVRLIYSRLDDLMRHIGEQREVVADRSKRAQENLALQKASLHEF